MLRCSMSGLVISSWALSLTSERSLCTKQGPAMLNNSRETL